MSRRDQITMSSEELRAFLDERHTLNVATYNHDGTIHLVAMWYAMDGDDVVFWTYGKSQKVRNVERDPRTTCLVEDGAVYEELRGAELVGTAEIVHDRDAVLDIGIKVSERYVGPVTDETMPFIEATAAKRVGVRVAVDRVVSWDHRKLGGAY